MIWRWEDAPEDLRAYSRFGGGEESVIYVPPEAIDVRDGLMKTKTSGLWFLCHFPKRGEHNSLFGDDGWGEYQLYDLPSGGRVAITAASWRPTGDSLG
jgi:hypothetical protein